MAIDYSCVDGAAPQKESTPTQADTATVTIRVDADCFLLCDGEYIEHPLKAGVITKMQLPLGQHLLEFLYTEDPDIKIEKEVDFSESGKSYLVLIKSLQDLVDAPAKEAKRKAEEEARAKAAAKAKRKAEAKAKRKAEAEAEAEAERKAEEEARVKAAAEAKRKEEEKRKAGYKITNLTGEDFIDCTIYYYPSRYAGTIPTAGSYVAADDIGDFKWKESLTVRRWDGAWKLIGLNAYGQLVSTRITMSTTFTERDLTD